MDAGLLPVKSLDAAKSRLERFLDPAQRFELASAMLDDALDLCSKSDFLHWFVLSADDRVLERARERGFETVRDDAEGDLNGSLATGIRAAIAAGATSVTIIPVDAPLAGPDDLRDVLDTGATSDVVVVPAERDAGTNALYLSPPDVLAPRFGEHSLSAYVREAEAAKLRCALLPVQGLAIDIDIHDDVELIVKAAPDDDSRTLRLLRSWAPAED